MAIAKNIVLVHGAWCDGSSWNRVIPLLQDEGYRVIGVQLPLTSLSDDIACVRAALEFVGEPTLLVGHSYGGAVISGAATGLANVTGLVYVAAYAPDAGENLLDINGRFAATEGVQYIRPAYGKELLWIEPDGFARYFAPDIEPVQGKTLAAVQKPIAGACFGEKLAEPAWRSLPSWYVVSQNDQIINPEAERWMAQRMGATVVEVPSSHASPVSHPDEIARVILQAARFEASF